MRQLIILILFPINLALGQNLIISVSNPSPRLGQEINVYLRITDYYNPLDSIDGDIERDLGRGQIELNSWALDTGIVKIGPIAIVVNGVTYKSDSIELRVEQPLPAETLGLWIRQITFRDRDYLIVEQRIPGEWKDTKPKNKNTFGTEFTSEKYEFGELETDSFDASKVKLFHKYSTKRIDAAGQRLRGGNANTTYKVSVYEIRKGPKFRGEYEIKREQFKKLPRDIKFETWTIR